VAPDDAALVELALAAELSVAAASIAIAVSAANMFKIFSVRLWYIVTSFGSGSRQRHEARVSGKILVSGL
jgi:hypothetical protein